VIVAAEAVAAPAASDTTPAATARRGRTRVQSAHRATVAGRAGGRSASAAWVSGG
jgi:hypothetical protein